MRYGPDGSVVGGMASVHVNGVVRSAGGNPQWRDAARIVFQIEKAGDKGKLYQLTAPWTGTPTLVDDKPSSQIVAGGGNWAAWNVADGYRDSYGKKTRWYPIACDDSSGLIAVVTDQQNAIGLAIWNGSTLRTIKAGPIGEACFRGGLLVYRDSGQLRAWSVLTGGPVAIANPPGLAGVQHSGGYLLLGRSRSKAIYDLYLVRVSDPLRGLHLVASNNADFYPDLRVKADGTVEVISSPTQGDTLPIKRYALNPTTATWLPLGVPPPPKPDPDMPPDDEDDAMDEARLRKIERAIADLQEEVDELRKAIEGGTPPEPPPPDQDGPPVIPLEAVAWLGRANPLEFRVTSHIEDVTIEKKKDDGKSTADGDNWLVCFPHTKSGKWPALPGDGTTFEGNVCAFARIGGRWYGDTVEYLKVGQTCKRFSNLTGKTSWGLGPHATKDPMRSWGPRPGEWFGLMVCTPVREGIEGPSQERSQIFLTRWP